MDDLDRDILRHLQEDGRLSNVELAERVRLSPSPCLRRVRALERSGVIRGYHADIDPASVGRGLEITVHVELTFKDRATVEAFEAGIAAFDEVVECRRMFGVPDYIGYQTAGASDYAIQKVWVPVPEGLDLTQAATLPMAVETATAPLSSRR